MEYNCELFPSCKGYEVKGVIKAQNNSSMVKK